MQDETVEASGGCSEVSHFDKWHDFWLAATPKFFEWLQWAAVLGLLTYAYAKHSTIWLALLVGLGYLSLIFYFGGFFVRRSVELPWIKNKTAQSFIWQILAIMLGYATSVLIQHAVAAFAIGTL